MGQTERRARAATRWLRGADRPVLLIGVVLLGFYLGAEVHSFVFSRLALAQSDPGGGHAVLRSFSTQVDPLTGKMVDFGLWGKTRAKAYEMSLSLPLDPPIAVLTIPKVHLTVPVFDGTGDITLNRGVGRIAGTALPGQDGNLAIAGHRDGFFRSLKGLSVGDVVGIATREERDTYVVSSMEIVQPSDVSVLEPGPVTMLTLVTCYPFYFLGSAPERFIVKASLTHRFPMQQAQASPQEINSREKEK